MKNRCKRKYVRQILACIGNLNLLSFIIADNRSFDVQTLFFLFGVKMMTVDKMNWSEADLNRLGED